MRYQVRLSVPRTSGRRAWGAAAGAFERRLAEQESAAVAARVDSEVLRGRDYVRVVIVAAVDAADVAEALDRAWWTFRKAAGEDLAGWDLVTATAEVRPEGPLVAGRKAPVAIPEWLAEERAPERRGADAGTVLRWRRLGPVVRARLEDLLSRPNVLAELKSDGRRQLTLHLPQYWHRESEWLALFEAACGPPARAACG
jgi:hypothetical protein